MEPTGLSQPESSDASLARRARAGDEVAFDTLAHRYRAAVLAVAFSRTGDREEAEDLAQQVLLRAWRALPSLRDPAAFAGWLRAIAVNACRDWFRRTRPWCYSLDDPAVLPLPADIAVQPVEVLLRRERERSWRRALATIPVENQRVLLMHAWGAYSYEQIAAFLGVPVTTVEGRIYRAKAQLRRRLQDAEAADLLGETLGLRQKEER